MGRSWTFPPSGRRTKVDHILRDQNFIFHCRRPGQDASRFVIPWFAVDGKKSPYNPETSQKFSSENHDPQISQVSHPKPSQPIGPSSKFTPFRFFVLNLPISQYPMAYWCSLFLLGPTNVAPKPAHQWASKISEVQIEVGQRHVGDL